MYNRYVDGLATSVPDDAGEHERGAVLGEPGWENTTVLRGDLLDEVRRLKAVPGGDVCSPAASA